MSDVSETIRSLTKNERPRAIYSGRSEEMSDRERIAQVAHQNERMSESLIFLRSLICSFLNKKRAIRLEIKWTIYQPWGIVKSCFTQMLLNIQICILPFLVARKQN